MAKYCKKFNETDKNLDDILSNIIIDKKHNISWCPIYKAASSTWMKNFAVLGGILSKPIIKLLKENKVALNVLVKQTFSHVLVNNATVTLSELEDTRKILIVRHPLERLLSAYRDKLENMINREYYYKRFGRYIAYKYHESRKENETSLEPTFKEFLQYIVDEKYFDEHWAPYYSTCIPCTINYDFILKLETLDEDEKFLIQETGLVYELDLHEVSKVKNSNPNGITNEEVVVKYLKNIPASLLQKLDKIYDKDFKLFNYESSQQYLMKNQT
ncbi:carbohydrate sulfotransferase 9-like [Prorops nasuta]